MAVVYSTAEFFLGLSYVEGRAGKIYQHYHVV